MPGERLEGSGKSLRPAHGDMLQLARCTVHLQRYVCALYHLSEN